MTRATKTLYLIFIAPLCIVFAESEKQLMLTQLMTQFRARFVYLREWFRYVGLKSTSVKCRRRRRSSIICHAFVDVSTMFHQRKISW